MAAGRSLGQRRAAGTRRSSASRTISDMWVGVFLFVPEALVADFEVLVMPAARRPPGRRTSGSGPPPKHVRAGAAPAGVKDVSALAALRKWTRPSSPS